MRERRRRQARASVTVRSALMNPEKFNFSFQNALLGRPFRAEPWMSLKSNVFETADRSPPQLILRCFTNSRQKLGFGTEAM
jgi:hypothetical protein